jgi:type IV pilus assembly protein PilA
MIIVAVIGVLVAIAIPNLRRAAMRARLTSFARNVRFCAGAFQLYLTETGVYPTNTGPNTIPVGMESYLRNVNWSRPTAIGGHWQWLLNSGGVKAGVSVVSPMIGTRELEELDRLLDNGDLNSGVFRKFDDSTYMYVLEE